MNVTKSPLEVHLETSSPVTRDNTRWAFLLNEFGQPTRKANTTELRVAAIHDIIDWLDVEDSERYRPRSSSTYCNIYAHDFCYLCSVYIPRVWWDNETAKKVMSGENIIPRYGSNVFELNANALFDWLEEFGTEFGWKATNNLNELQDLANKGHICIIVAKRKDLARSGHITAVVPETDVFQAKRENDRVIVPVESQAGSRNYEYVTKDHQWWNKAKFSGFKFWVHE
jgi:hypothetical protein